jgi:integrase
VTVRRTLPPGAEWITLPSGAKRIQLVVELDRHDGKRHKTKRRYRTVDDAWRGYHEISDAQRTGLPVGGRSPTVEAACAAWLSGKRGVKATTLAGYTDALKPVREVLSATPIDKLIKANLDRLVDDLMVGGVVTKAQGKPRRAWSPRMVRLMLTTLEQVLASAVAQGLIARNVAALVERPAAVKTTKRTLKAEEITTLLARVTGTQYEVAWRLALYGLRRGELCGLRWEDIEGEQLAIARTRSSVDGKIIETDPKSYASARALPLTVALKAALGRARKLQAAQRIRLGQDYADSGYVVVDEGGIPPHPDWVSDEWTRTLVAAGVQRVRLHDGRHTCATTMAQEGAPAVVIAAWLGHASAEFAQRTYVHVTDVAVQAGADYAERHLSGSG